MARCVHRSLVLAAILAAPVAAPAAFAQTRLEVGYISREPRIPPPTSAQAPREEGWPDAGSRVHWVAHVVNRGTAAVAAVPYFRPGVERGEMDLAVKLLPR
jgi:hypothetical protein